MSLHTAVRPCGTCIISSLTAVSESARTHASLHTAVRLCISARISSLTAVGVRDAHMIFNTAVRPYMWCTHHSHGRESARTHANHAVHMIFNTAVRPCGARIKSHGRESARTHESLSAHGRETMWCMHHQSHGRESARTHALHESPHGRATMQCTHQSHGGRKSARTHV